jgi:hypothetical protein
MEQDFNVSSRQTVDEMTTVSQSRCSVAEEGLRDSFVSRTEVM